jgi:putative DNA primase/helicase
MAEALIQTHRLVYLMDTGELCEYEKGAYHRGVEVSLAHHIEAINQSAKNQFINEVIGKVKRRVEMVRAADFDADPYLVNVKNGVLDLNSGVLLENSPKRLFLNQLDVEYNPRARTKRFQRFMISILPDPADRLRVIDHFASCLTRTPIKKDLMCVGETDSGKSTLLGLIRRFLGPENVCSVSLQELETDRFAAADLFGKLANIHPDIDDQELKRTSKFKTTSGSDQIRAQRKYGHPFFYVSYAKHFYSANRIPATKDESEAFFNRWNVVFFPTRFVEDPERYSESNRTLEGIRRRDPKILDRLLTPEERSGILNVLLARAKRILRTEGIPNSQSIAEVRDLWLYHSDFIENFLKDNVEEDPEGRVSKAELYRLYAAYCRDRKVTAKSKQFFNARVERRGGEEAVGKVEGQSVKQWRGLSLDKSETKSVELIVVPKRSTKSTERSLPLISGLADSSLSVAAGAIRRAEGSG